MQQQLNDLEAQVTTLTDGTMGLVAEVDKLVGEVADAASQGHRTGLEVTSEIGFPKWTKADGERP